MTTKLLAVDDSKTMRRVLEITFGGDDFQTTIASNADQALAAVRADPPQIALVDAHLGSESGYELCRAIKDAAPGTRVLMLSSKQRPYDAGHGESVSADGYFDKPFDSTKMIARVRQELEGLTSPGLASPQPSSAQPSSAQARPAQAPASPGGFTSKPSPQPTGASSAAAQPSSFRGAGSGAADTRTAGESPGRRPLAPEPRVSPSPPQASLSVGATAPSSRQAGSSKAAVSAPNSAAGGLESRLEGLGLSAEQIQSVVALSQEVVEQVVWEVVPALAEAMIKEEIARLTAE